VPAASATNLSRLGSRATVTGLAVLLTASVTAGPLLAGEANGVPSACTLPPPALARLGLGAVPAALAPADQRTVKAARRDLAKHGGAVKNLAAKYPEDPEVRFLLAGLHASEGAFAKACGEVARLLELDIAAFAPRYEREARFAKLRAGAEGARLREHLAAVEALWREATQSGLPAMLSRGSRGPMTIWRGQYLRGGVYLHETSRFLPLEPGVEGAVATLVDPRAGTVAVVRTAVSACHDHNCPRMSTAEVLVFRLDDWRRAPSRWRYAEADSTASALDVRSDKRGTAVRVHDCCCWNGCVSPWNAVGAKPQSAANESDDLLLSIDVRGSLLGIAPAGQQIRKGRLAGAGGAEVALASEHGDRAAVHDILVDQRTGVRLVLSTIDRCECSAKDEGPILRHALSTVDAQGKAAVVLRGEGAAAARLDGKQALYVQTGDTVRRWPSIAEFGKQPGPPIMPGVVLVVPRTKRGDCCGK
jgi:hypothetical protein